MRRYNPIPALCSHSRQKQPKHLTSICTAAASEEDLNILILTYKKAKRSPSGSSSGDAPEGPGAARPLLGPSQVQQNGVGHLHRLVFDQDDVEGVQVRLLPLFHLGGEKRGTVAALS